MNNENIRNHLLIRVNINLYETSMEWNYWIIWECVLLNILNKTHVFDDVSRYWRFEAQWCPLSETFVIVHDGIHIHGLTTGIGNQRRSYAQYTITLNTMRIGDESEAYQLTREIKNFRWISLLNPCAISCLVNFVIPLLCSSFYNLKMNSLLQLFCYIFCISYFYKFFFSVITKLDIFNKTQRVSKFMIRPFLALHKSQKFLEPLHPILLEYDSWNFKKTNWIF